MGLLMFLGMIGTIAYSGYAVKNDINAIVTDSTVKPMYNQQNSNNYEKIELHFVSILKRCNIKYDKETLNPTENHPNQAIAYLRKQGYQSHDIEYFKKIFTQRYQEQQKIRTKKLKEKQKSIEQQLNNSQLCYYTLSLTNCSTMNTQEKMEKIMENPLWNMLVDNYTYIDGGICSDKEIWNLYIPINLKNKRKLHKLYLEICNEDKIPTMR